MRVPCLLSDFGGQHSKLEKITNQFNIESIHENLKLIFNKKYSFYILFLCSLERVNVQNFESVFASSCSSISDPVIFFNLQLCKGLLLEILL